MTNAQLQLFNGLIHTLFEFDKEDDPNVIGVPIYSESIDLAFKVLEKLRGSGEYCCLDILSDFHYVWTVKLVKQNSEKHETYAYATDFELPMAICRCALQSKEINLSEIFKND